MAIFREFDSLGRDRAGEDRRRHRELVEDAIRKNLGDIIAEESIIGQNRDKKVKVPIKGVKEYQFIYGKNILDVGSGTGDEERGDVIGSDKSQGNLQGQVGNSEGEDIYELEITIDELINYLFEDLNLPNMKEKNFNEIETKEISRRLGYQRKGIFPRLAKKRSMVEKIKRKKGYERTIQEYGGDIEFKDEERFPFKEDDFRYYRLREDVRRESNAVVICIMDTSGSMDASKKYLARTFYFLLYQFIRIKYVNVDIVFIAHTTEAYEVNEDDFFHKGESGGTYVSSGYEKALEIIEKRYNPDIWNVYTFHCSDGDNWTEDNPKAIKLAQELCQVCNLFGYGEVKSGYNMYSSSIRNEFETHVKNSNFTTALISKKEDIIPALTKLLEKESRDNKNL
ncbi:sporulation protein YhbH [Tissierella creatinini]|nr:sporulation protein YhbH [Tissierella creatinini]TJX62816.1 sporulation protein YhbH [Soehngenia saccharolytica]